MRDSTIFYRSFYEAIKELSPELQAQVYSAIFEYALNFKETELTGLAKTVFTLVKPQLDANLKRYASGTVPKQKRNRSETEANNKRKRSETEANVNDNDNVNDNVNLNLNVNENKKRNRFVKPQPKEVYDYMTELNQDKGNRWTESKVRMEAQNFHDYYESNGWHVGKKKMSDLKATIRRWMNNDMQKNNTNNNEQRIADHIAKHSDNPHYLNLFPNLNKATTTH